MNKNLRVNLLYVFGFICAFHSPTGHPLVELALPFLLLASFFSSSAKYSLKKVFAYSFVYIFASCLLFSLFYIFSGQASYISSLYPGIYSSFLYQGLRVLLLPIAMITGYSFSSLGNYKSYIDGLLRGLILSIIFGVFLNLIHSSDFRLKGFSGEPRHLGQLIAVTFLLYIASRSLVTFKKSYLFNILPFFLPLTFSFTGIMSLITPITTYFSINRIALFFKLRASRYFFFCSLLFGIFTIIIVFLFESILRVRGINLSITEDFNILAFLDYALAKDTVPLRYMIASPFSLLSGLGPSGLQIQFISTKLSLIAPTPHLASVEIFEPYFNSSVLESILVPSSSGLYFISISGIVPLIFLFHSLKRSLIVKRYSDSPVSTFSFYVSLAFLTLFASYSNFIILIFALSLTSTSRLRLPDKAAEKI